MLDEKDLESIAKLVKNIVKDEVSQVEDRIAKNTKAMIDASEDRIAKNTVTLMDAEFTPKFNLLAEELQIIRDRLPDPEELEKMQDELDLHHAMLKKHTREIQSLKKAN